ncbi:hypothetical protein RRG08_055327 [Elysia crispata]|uniref:Uncharacterized protein n=1 Tax=Elysia crispata TaxID=231223 RepID=A0AAE1E3E7_9GAST|nr:hypothetical protein RRG08_055327 [Elysia crispata]
MPPPERLGAAREEGSLSHRLPRDEGATFHHPGSFLPSLTLEDIGAATPRQEEPPERVKTSTTTTFPPAPLTRARSLSRNSLKPRMFNSRPPPFSINLSPAHHHSPSVYLPPTTILHKFNSRPPPFSINLSLAHYHSPSGLLPPTTILHQFISRPLPFSISLTPAHHHSPSIYLPPTTILHQFIFRPPTLSISSYPSNTIFKTIILGALLCFIMFSELEST